MKNQPSTYMKKLSLGIVLALGFESAQSATIIADKTDLFLSVWDSIAQQSYAIDLGITLASFMTQDTHSINFTLSPSFKSWATAEIGQGHFLTYNIAAQDLQLYRSTNPKDAMLLSQDHSRTGYFTPVLTTMANSSLNTSQLKIQNRINDINVTGTDLVTDPALQGYFQGVGANAWGIGQGSSSRDDSSTIGPAGTGTNQLDIYIVTSSGTQSNIGKTKQSWAPGYFTLTNSYDLNYVVTSTVPEPEQVLFWLTGLAFMHSWINRRKATITAS